MKIATTAQLAKMARDRDRYQVFVVAPDGARVWTETSSELWDSEFGRRCVIEGLADCLIFTREDRSRKERPPQI